MQEVRFNAALCRCAIQAAQSHELAAFASCHNATMYQSRLMRQHAALAHLPRDAMQQLCKYYNVAVPAGLQQESHSKAAVLGTRTANARGAAQGPIADAQHPARGAEESPAAQDHLNGRVAPGQAPLAAARAEDAQVPGLDRHNCGAEPARNVQADVNTLFGDDSGSSSMSDGADAGDYGAQEHLPHPDATEAERYGHADAESGGTPAHEAPGAQPHDAAEHAPAAAVAEEQPASGCNADSCQQLGEMSEAAALKAPNIVCAGTDSMHRQLGGVQSQQRQHGRSLRGADSPGKQLDGAACPAEAQLGYSADAGQQREDRLGNIQQEANTDSAQLAHQASGGEPAAHAVAVPQPEGEPDAFEEFMQERRQLQSERRRRWRLKQAQQQHSSEEEGAVSHTRVQRAQHMGTAAGVEASVRLQVQRFVGSVVEPLLANQRLTVAQYTEVLGRAVEKVMKAHSGATDASFLQRDAQKIKRLVDRYVQFVCKPAAELKPA